MEFAVISLFCLLLGVCIAAERSVLLAMCAGFFLFFVYGLLRRCTARELMQSALEGVRLVWPVIVSLLLIGIISAAWRASGTIAFIVVWATGFISPASLVLLAFWCNALMSFLTGTAFGTVSIMGVIFMSIGLAVNVDPALLAGAIISGIYFGDRCSPMSSTAVFVATITQTSLAVNLRRMLASAAVPFVAASAVYLAAGVMAPAPAVDASGVRTMLSTEFNLSVWTLLPVAALGLLFVQRIPLRVVMLASIAAAAAVAVVVQQRPALDMARVLVWGYASREAMLAPMINGGGAVSMLTVCGIAAVSASFSGLFRVTGLLAPFARRIPGLARAATPVGCLVITAAGSAMVSCNQLLSVMFTRDLCAPLFDRQRLAIGLENSCILIAGLVPWSIASTVPVQTLGAPTACLLFAFYLYFVPLWSILAQALPEGRIRDSLGV